MDLGSRGIVLSIKRKQRCWAVTAQLICAFVFAYAKSRFSHDAAHTNELQLDWAFYCQVMHFGAIIQYLVFEGPNIKIYWCVKCVIDRPEMEVNITFHTPTNFDIGLFKHQLLFYHISVPNV